MIAESTPPTPGPAAPTGQDAGYRGAMAQLVAARDEYQREIERLRVEHADRAARIQTAVDQAGAAVAASRAKVRAALTLIEQVDADATGMWRSVRETLPGRLAVLAGPVPLPAEPHRRPEAGPASTITDLFSRANQGLAGLRERERLSGRGYALLAALGAVSAIVGYLVALAVAAIGHLLGAPVEAPLVAAGRVVALISPLAGVPVARWSLARDRIPAGLPATALVVAVGAVVSFGGVPLLLGY